MSLIPLEFAMLGAKNIVCEANSDIDGRTHGAKRRAEAICEAPNVLLIDYHYKLIREGSYIVFDSWFCSPSLIRGLAGRKLHVIGRVKIEEFFKVAKSLLKQEREFQGRCYDTSLLKLLPILRCES